MAGPIGWLRRLLLRGVPGAGVGERPPLGGEGEGVRHDGRGPLGVVPEVGHVDWPRCPPLLDKREAGVEGHLPPVAHWEFARGQPGAVEAPEVPLDCD